MDSATKDEMVVMARIAAPFGIKGWVKLQVFTEAPDSLDAYANWFVRSPAGWLSMELEDFAVNAKSVVAKLKGVDDRTAAERLAKRDIALPRSALDELGEGEAYWIDLIGCEVVDRAGKSIGRVESLMETGANDVLVVKGSNGEELIPYIAGVIHTVDREAKRITVDWSGEYA